MPAMQDWVEAIRQPEEIEDLDVDLLGSVQHLAQ